jgi:hypothetical protein
VERSGGGKEPFQQSLLQLSPPKRSIPCKYSVGSAGDVPLDEIADADVIILDPPRKGLELSLLSSLCSSVQRNWAATHHSGISQSADAHNVSSIRAGSELEAGGQGSLQQLHDLGDVSTVHHILASRGACSTYGGRKRSCALSKQQSESCRDKGGGNLESCGNGNEQTLIYLSCGFRALMRDVQVLLDGGEWKLSSVQTFIFFPGTDSIETLVLMKRVRH